MDNLNFHRTLFTIDPMFSWSVDLHFNGIINSIICVFDGSEGRIEHSVPEFYAEHVYIINYLQILFIYTNVGEICVITKIMGSTKLIRSLTLRQGQ